MLKKIIASIFKSSPKKDEVTLIERMDAAAEIRDKGDIRAAILAFREILEIYPDNAAALNNLGVCLNDVGNSQEAAQCFELAYSLDDAYLPVIANHAQNLVEQKKCAEAMRYLEQGKATEPFFGHLDAVYASCQALIGDMERACFFQLNAWLANFDNLRTANSHLFYSAYHDMDERKLAAEHQFWGETVRPLYYSEEGGQEENVHQHDQSNYTKIRIGYWSPDLRGHSVRYFFRPLLEGHDRDKFEVFVFHDGPASDVQTELIEKASDKFIPVFGMTDKELASLIKSQRLDVLVEMAGHSSHNRLNMLQERLAFLQISGIGYPPTTGLKTVDAKILDRHLLGSEPERYYAEKPLVLPTSFWCFDPKEDVPDPVAPPFTKNGFITFGCVGNIAKISLRMLNAWASILSQVPNSRLIIRSISCEDSLAVDTLSARIKNAGIDLARVDIRKGAGGGDFYSSYGEIDVILDTFPFNGGTTSCFAVYMGVPIVSLAGQSLISRMGLSILSNVGAPELVVYDYSEYVNCAVSLAGKSEFLKQFRSSARDAMRKTSLGDGKLFAHDFELACEAMIKEKQEGRFNYQSNIDYLPPNELVRRAYAVLGSTQTDAADRIVRHCLNQYPNYAPAHIFCAQRMADKGAYDEALAYLTSKALEATPADRAVILISMIRSLIILQRHDDVARTLDEFSDVPVHDEFDRMQIKLYEASNVCKEVLAHPDVVENSRKSILVLIPCDDEAEFENIRRDILQVCAIPSLWTVVFKRCSEDRKHLAYAKTLQESVDVVIILQRDIHLCRHDFFHAVVEELNHSDIVGFAGATRWQRFDWRSDAFGAKSGGYFAGSLELSGGVDIRLMGLGQEVTVRGQAILDGRLLALVPARVKAVEFDSELIGFDVVLEEDWSHAAYLAGLRLAVHRNLGVAIGHREVSYADHVRSPVMTRLREKYQFQLFEMTNPDLIMLSVPVSSAVIAVDVVDKFFELIMIQQA